MSDDPALLKDDELCDALRISRRTLNRHIDECRPYTIKIRSIRVGGERRWVRRSLEQFINGETKEV